MMVKSWTVDGEARRLCNAQYATMGAPCKGPSGCNYAKHLAEAIRAGMARAAAICVERAKRWRRNDVMSVAVTEAEACAREIEAHVEAAEPTTTKGDPTPMSDPTPAAIEAAKKLRGPCGQTLDVHGRCLKCGERPRDPGVSVPSCLCGGLLIDRSGGAHIGESSCPFCGLETILRDQAIAAARAEGHAAGRREGLEEAAESLFNLSCRCSDRIRALLASG